MEEYCKKILQSDIESIQSILKLCKTGESDYHSTDAPFFNINVDNHSENKKDHDKVIEYIEDIQLPKYLKHLYVFMGDTKREFYKNDWIFLQLNEIKKRQDHYKSVSQNRAVDFAFKNQGMGHCTVATYDPLTEKIYFRNDGGSNGYDRQYNYEFAISYVPEIEKCIDFKDWIHENNIHTTVN